MLVTILLWTEATIAALFEVVLAITFLRYRRQIAGLVSLARNLTALRSAMVGGIEFDVIPDVDSTCLDSSNTGTVRSDSSESGSDSLGSAPVNG